MRISRIQIANFRNFAALDLHLSENAVVVGENKVGKSNLLYAIRLVLDPSLSDSARELRAEDFWDGLPRPLTRADKITISIDLTDFESNEDLVALLCEHVVEPEPMTARLTYVYQPIETLEGEPTKESDYEFVVYGGDRTESHVGYEIRRGLPVDLLPALRDAEGDIANWRRSPLRPLLDAVAGRITAEQLGTLADAITTATHEVAATAEVKELVDAINERVEKMVGSKHAMETALGFSPTDPGRLLRALRVFIDAGKRDIGAASLGSANVLYLTLKALEIDQAAREGQRHHTFLAIEEPEAHLHPHLQRLVYRDFLRAPAADNGTRAVSILLTTHSPHIASVAPLRSIVLLRKTADGRASEGVTTARLTLDEGVVADLERYLDVTRAEMLFAKAVILVEGEAERFLVPALAKAAGIDFDELGITVCSVAGTNFGPYLALLGEQGLQLPVAVITDGDPDDQGSSRGNTRILSMLAGIAPPNELAGLTTAQKLALAADRGLFVGDQTLEVDLFRAGAHEEIAETLSELAPGGTARTRAEGWRTTPATLDVVQFLKDVKAISKGRFAQRLATRVAGGQVPAYITNAIDYARTHCR
jgi:putative ATP-dependent endonuclease of OLD family